MATKIKALIIVCQQGVSQYFIGDEYEGLLLDRIEDRSIESQDSIEFIYQGLTKAGDIVFEAINAPIEVRYTADEKKGFNQ